MVFDLDETNSEKNKDGGYKKTKSHYYENKGNKMLQILESRNNQTNKLKSILIDKVQEQLLDDFKTQLNYNSKGIKSQKASKLISKRNDIAHKTYKNMTRADLGKIYRDARGEMSNNLESDFESSCSNSESGISNDLETKIQHRFLSEENIQKALAGVELNDLTSFSPSRSQIVEIKKQNLKNQNQKIKRSGSIRRKSVLQAQNDFHALLSDQTNVFNQQLLQKVSKLSELKTNKKNCQLIIPCQSKFRLKFDMFVILLSIYNCFMIPIQISFGEVLFQKNDKERLDYLDTIIDAIFIMDIIFNFVTTYFNQKTGSEVIDQKQIALRYLKGSFFLDTAAVVPFDLLYKLLHNHQIGVIDIDDTSQQSIKIIGLLKMIRLLRLRRIISLMNFANDFKFGIKLVIIIICFITIIHWTSCIWFMIIENDHHESILNKLIEQKSSQRLLQQINLQLATKYDVWVPPQDLNNKFTLFYTESIRSKWVQIYYFTILLILGNEIAPQTVTQVMFCICVMIFGSFLMAYIFGQLATIMAEDNKKYDSNEKNLQLVKHEMVERQISEEIQKNITNYMQKVQDIPQSQYEFQHFMKIQQPIMKNGILRHLYEGLLTTSNLFKIANTEEQLFIVHNLKTEIFVENERVLQQNDIGDKMYIIVEGKVQLILNKRNNVIIKMNRQRAKKRSVVHDSKGLAKDINQMLQIQGQLQKNQSFSSTINYRRTRRSILRQNQARVIESLESSSSGMTDSEDIDQYECSLSSESIQSQTIDSFSSQSTIKNSISSAIKQNKELDKQFIPTKIQRRSKSEYDDQTTNTLAIVTKNKALKRDSTTIMKALNHQSSLIDYDEMNNSQAIGYSKKQSLIQKMTDSFTIKNEQSRKTIQEWLNIGKLSLQEKSKGFKEFKLNTLPILSSFNTGEIYKNPPVPQNKKKQLMRQSSQNLQNKINYSKKMLDLQMRQNEMNKEQIQSQIEQEMLKLETEFYNGVDLENEDPFDFLEEGSYFGEVALFSEYRRTCSVKTMTPCIFATIDRTVTKQIKQKYPILAQSISDSMKNYHDDEMEQRRRFIQNIPIFTDIDDQQLISDIMFLMTEETYQIKQVILKKGFINENIMIIWEGAVEIIVNRVDPETGMKKTVWFENINRGTCMNVYCAFTDQMSQLVDFIALSRNCKILNIKVSDLRKLARRNQPILQQKLDQLDMRIQNDLVDNMDYFRFQNKYINLVSYDTEQSEQEANKRKKVRTYLISMITKFVKRFKAGKAKIPQAVELLNTVRQDKLKLLQEMNNMVVQKSEFNNNMIKIEEFKNNHAHMEQQKQNHIYEVIHQDYSKAYNKGILEQSKSNKNGTPIQTKDTKSNKLQSHYTLDKISQKLSANINLTDQEKNNQNLFKLRMNLNVLKRLKKQSIQKNNAKVIFQNLFTNPQLFSQIIYPVLETKINDYQSNNIEIINDVLMGFKDYSKQFYDLRDLTLISIQTMCSKISGNEFNQIMIASRKLNYYKPNQDIIDSEESLSQMTQVFGEEKNEKSNTINSKIETMQKEDKGSRLQNWIYEQQFISEFEKTYNDLLKVKEKRKTLIILQQAIEKQKKTIVAIQKFQRRRQIGKCVKNDLGDIYFEANLIAIEIDIQEEYEFIRRKNMKLVSLNNAIKVEQVQQKEKFNKAIIIQNLIKTQLRIIYDEAIFNHIKNEISDQIELKEAMNRIQRQASLKRQKTKKSTSSMKSLSINFNSDFGEKDIQKNIQGKMLNVNQTVQSASRIQEQNFGINNLRLIIQPEGNQTQQQTTSRSEEGQGGVSHNLLQIELPHISPIQQHQIVKEDSDPSPPLIYVQSWKNLEKLKSTTSKKIKTEQKNNSLNRFNKVYRSSSNKNKKNIKYDEVQMISIEKIHSPKSKRKLIKFPKIQQRQSLEKRQKKKNQIEPPLSIYTRPLTSNQKSKNSRRSRQNSAPKRNVKTEDLRKPKIQIQQFMEFSNNSDYNCSSNAKNPSNFGTINIQIYQPKPEITLKKIKFDIMRSLKEKGRFRIENRSECYSNSPHLYKQDQQEQYQKSKQKLKQFQADYDSNFNKILQSRQKEHQQRSKSIKQKILKFKKEIGAYDLNKSPQQKTKNKEHLQHRVEIKLFD